MAGSLNYNGKTQMYIDGKWVDSVSGQYREIFYPCTGEVITKVTEGNAEDVKLAVQAARQAFDKGDWPNTPAAERGRLVEKLAAGFFFLNRGTGSFPIRAKDATIPLFRF